jgi:solute carrier family 13 (sodium-dependent dicarboxylate transporter), member 2/3/5
MTDGAGARVLRWITGAPVGDPRLGRREEPGRAGLRARIGLPLGPLLALVVWRTLELPGLTSDGRAVAAVATLMLTWWVSEPIPLAVTALLPVVLLPMTGAQELGVTTAAYGDSLVFLFLGGFVLAFAMQRWGLHRRVALLTVMAVGTDTRRLVGGFMLATAVLSMWVSNTATTVMMLPVGLSVLALVTRSEGSGDATARMPRLAVGLMLGIAYAASIGSLATLIGTPTNALIAAFVRTSYGVDLGFGRWLLFALPLSLTFLTIAWWLLTRVLYPPEVADLAQGRAAVEAEYATLGPLSRGERNVLLVFVLMAGSWILRQPLQAIPLLAAGPLGSVDDATIAIAGAVLLFALPVDARGGVFTMSWDTTRTLPWDVLVLFGGALALAGAVTRSGLDVALGAQLRGLAGLPTLVLLLAVAAVVLLVTELMSNTAALAAIAPVLGGVAVSFGVDPLLLLVPAALASSCAFALPVATPPNAIVFGSGHVTVPQMLRAGVVLNLVGVVLIAGYAWLVVPLVFPSVG